MARLLRANWMVGPFPGRPAGGWGVRAGLAAMPGVTLGAGPNGSVWMREASMPRAARPALISSIKGAGPHRYRSEERRVGKECRTRWWQKQRKKKRWREAMQAG